MLFACFFFPLGIGREEVKETDPSQHDLLQLSTLKQDAYSHLRKSLKKTNPNSISTEWTQNIYFENQ